MNKVVKDLDSLYSLNMYTFVFTQIEIYITFIPCKFRIGIPHKYSASRQIIFTSIYFRG